MKKSAIFQAALFALSLPALSYAQGALENPTANVVESGIGIVSGWHCTAKEVTVKVDGIDLGRSGVGSVRNDTKSFCGDVDNGFSLLFNYNDLSSGKHTIETYADGKLLAKRTFYSIASLGEKYVTDVHKKIISVDNFPEQNKAAVLVWRNELQNYIVENIVDTSTIYGFYVSDRSILETSSAFLSRDTDLKSDDYHDQSTLEIRKNSIIINQKYSIGRKVFPEKIFRFSFVDNGDHFIFNGSGFVPVHQRGSKLMYSGIAQGSQGLQYEINSWIKVKD